MMHRFSWRLGIVVILVILAGFAWLYPYLYQKQTVPVRQTTEIRSGGTADDDSARQAIERDNTN